MSILAVGLPEARGAGSAKAMADPRMKRPDGRPFDGKRLIHGGVQAVVEAGSPKPRPPGGGRGQGPRRREESAPEWHRLNLRRQC